MHPNVIQFACGHCGTQLTVPMQMAGVSGPCPKCSNTVVSPTPQATDVTGSMWGPAQLTLPLSKLIKNEPPATTPPAAAGVGTGTVPAPQNQHEWAANLGNPAPARVNQSQTPTATSSRPLSQPLQPMSSAMLLPPSFQGNGAEALGVGIPAAVPPPLSQPPLPSLPTVAPAASWSASSAQPTGRLLNTLLSSGPVLPQTPVAPLSMPDAGRVQLPPQRPAQQPPASAFPQPGYSHPAPQVQLPPSPEPSNSGTPDVSSRPMAVSGSRISLLARQLGTEEAGGNQPPPIAQPLSPEELKPASAAISSITLPRAQPAPVGSVLLPAAGGHSSVSSSHRIRNVTLAAVFLLGGLGFVGWKFRPQIEKMLGHYSTEGLPPEEPVVSTPESMPVVDPAKIHSDASDPSPHPGTASSAPQPIMAKPEVIAQPEQVPTTPSVPEPVVVPASTAPLEVSSPTTHPEQVAVAKMMPIELPPPAATTPNTSLVEIGKPESLDQIKSATAQSGTTDEGGLQFRDVPAEVKVAADGLRSFLLAKDWQERMNYTLHPEKMLEKLKSYYEENTDGPVEVNLVEYLRHDKSPQTGSGEQVIFVLSGKSWPYSFPVMVEQNGEEARVDWLTFVEFKDDLLRHFLESDLDTPWSFHVELRRAHYFEDNVPNADKMDCFEILSVMGTAHTYAFVPRDSPLAKSLANTITWDKEVSYVVANLQWRTHASGKWLELVGLPQLNWYTAPDVATTSAPAAKPASVE